ncbi:hypothetical protein RUM43_008678 [Polyplax serrata]|uniref:Uncharacterized protein n=1 Tax=Polyplax serrata TaxID=468196 RepID=A0AAN8S406_POLSC
MSDRWNATRVLLTFRRGGRGAEVLEIYVPPRLLLHLNVLLVDYGYATGTEYPFESAMTLLRNKIKKLRADHCVNYLALVNDKTVGQILTSVTTKETKDCRVGASGASCATSSLPQLLTASTFLRKSSISSTDFACATLVLPKIQPSHTHRRNLTDFLDEVSLEKSQVGVKCQSKILFEN